MSELFKGVGELISKRANRGSIGMRFFVSLSQCFGKLTGRCAGEVKVLVLSEDRQAIGQLKENMKKSKEKFDRGLQMQNAINIANLEMTLKQYGISTFWPNYFLLLMFHLVSIETGRRGVHPQTR